MNFYVPLLDENLKSYFKNQVINKELVNRGFINKKGFINYDPYYRDSMKEEKKRAASKEGGRVGRFQNVNKEKERVIKYDTTKKKKLTFSEKNKKHKNKKNVRNNKK